MSYRNHVLATLDPLDLEAIEPHLQALNLSKGQILTAQDAAVEEVYFPGSAYLANVMRFSDARTVETSKVGCEGVSGLAAFMAEPYGERTARLQEKRLGQKT